MLIICTTTDCYAKIKAFQAPLFPDDAFFREAAEFFAESRDRTGSGWYTLKPPLLGNGAVLIVFSVRDRETAFRRAATEGGQGLWYTMIDALHRIETAMRFTGAPITSGRVV